MRFWSWTGGGIGELEREGPRVKKGVGGRWMMASRVGNDGLASGKRSRMEKRVRFFSSVGRLGRISSSLTADSARFVP